MGAGKLVFVYGTLKRGGSNHLYLAGQTFVGKARTVPGFTLFELNGYPGMVVDPTSLQGVAGEVWSVDAQTLARLDDLEGVAEGLYRRESVPLASPFDREKIEGYLYARDTQGRIRIGSTWSEKS